MHLLLFLGESDKINTSEKVDELISAEIPNEDIYPHLYDVVKQFMDNDSWTLYKIWVLLVRIKILKKVLKIFQKILITKHLLIHQDIHYLCEEMMAKIL